MIAIDDVIGTFRRLPPAGTELGKGLLFRKLWEGAFCRDDEGLVRAVTGQAGIAHGVAVSQGRTALWLILASLPARPGADAVIVPAYTCYSVASAVARTGRKILPVDIDPGTLDYDRKALEKTDTSGVFAILSSNLFGIPNDLPYLERYAADKGICLVDDAAQAYGARVAGRWAGTFGTAGFYSLSKGKSFTTLEGGVIVTKDAGLALRLREARAHLPAPTRREGVARSLKLFAYATGMSPYLYGIPERLSFVGLGRSVFDPDFPAQRFPALLSRLGETLAREVDDINRVRRSNAERLLSLLGNGGAVRPVVGQEPGGAIYLRLPLVAATPGLREAIIRDLDRKGLGVSRSYPASVPRIPGIRRYLAREVSCPNADAVAGRIITLPTHTRVRPRHLALMAETIGRYTG